jgi:hypothetical protein
MAVAAMSSRNAVLCHEGRVRGRDLDCSVRGCARCVYVDFCR